MHEQALCFLPTELQTIEPICSPVVNVPISTSRELSTLKKMVGKFWEGLKIYATAAEPDAITQLPSTRLDCWRIYRVSFADGSASSHLVGYSANELRVTSAVNAVYPRHRRATTASGSVYHFPGDFGTDSQADSIFAAWLREVGAVRVFNVSSDFLAM